VALTKTGAGTATLSGANTYTGGTIVSAGTLLATKPAALPEAVRAEIVAMVKAVKQPS